MANPDTELPPDIQARLEQTEIKLRTAKTLDVSVGELFELVTGAGVVLPENSFEHEFPLDKMSHRKAIEGELASITLGLHCNPGLLSDRASRQEIVRHLIPKAEISYHRNPGNERILFAVDLDYQLGVELSASSSDVPVIPVLAYGSAGLLFKPTNYYIFFGNNIGDMGGLITGKESDPDIFPSIHQRPIREDVFSAAADVSVSDLLMDKEYSAKNRSLIEKALGSLADYRREDYNRLKREFDGITDSIMDSGCGHALVIASLRREESQPPHYKISASLDNGTDKDFYGHCYSLPRLKEGIGGQIRAGRSMIIINGTLPGNAATFTMHLHPSRP